MKVKLKMVTNSADKGKVLDINPCPVCKGKPEVDIFESKYIIFCSQSAFHNQPNDNSAFDEKVELAVESWNKRKPKE